MDVIKFYEHIGGDYETAKQRLMSDALIERLVNKFPTSQSLDGLNQAFDNSDYEKMFFEAHTLKGVALNLSFVKLGNKASELTELLRGDNRFSADKNTVSSLVKDINALYQDIVNSLSIY